MAPLRLSVGPPPVRAYLFHAYPLAILAGHGVDHLPWLYSTFVQLYQLPGSQLKFYLHPFCPGPWVRHSYWTTCPWLDVQSLDQALLCRSAGLSRFLGDALDAGLYPQIDVDYACLPGRGNASLVHEVLVCGYDTDRRLFEMIAYDARGHFGPSWISRDELEAAARAAEPPLPGRRERPRLFLYRYLEDATFRFDPIALGQQLRDYVGAANSSRRYRAIAPAVDGHWGVAVYQALIADLRALARGRHDAPDPGIPLRLLWEHKRLMVGRLSFLEGAGLVAADARRSQRLAELVERTYQARLVLLRWQREKHSESVHHAIDLLRDIATVESELYLPVAGQLDGGATSLTDAT